MKHLLTSRLAISMAVLLALCLPARAFAASAPDASTVDALVGQVATYESAQLKDPTFGNEWALMALARAGKLPDATKQTYLNNLAAYLEDHKNSLGTTVTDYDRVILALTSMGVDATAFCGIDLTAPLADMTAVTSPGVSGPIYALLALDSHGYASPTPRSALVDAILAAQLSGGGWNWGYGTAADPDLTSMALCALAPYYHAGDATVDAAVDDGLKQLSAIQDDATAGFAADWAPAPGSESSSQALTAISSLGIALDDARFVKTGGSLYDSLTSFLIDGGLGSKAFVDYIGDAAPSGMATEQGLYALVALARSLTGANRLYDMTDIKLTPFALETPDPKPEATQTEVATTPQPVSNTPATTSAETTIPPTGDPGSQAASLSLAVAALAVAALAVGLLVGARRRKALSR